MYYKYNQTPESYADEIPRNYAETDVAGNQKVTSATAMDSENDSVAAHPDNYSYKYQAAAAANVVVKPSAGYLHAIIVGEVIAGGTIEVSDHASDGDGNVQIFLDDPAVGTYIVDAYFAAGITVDIALQTKVTFIYR